MALSPADFEKLKTQLSARKSVPVQQAEPGFVEGVSTAFSKRTNAAADAQISDQNPLSKILQTVGQGAGFVGDVGFEGIKALTPEPVEDVVEEAVSTVASTKPVQDVVQRYESWKEQNPEAAANLEATVNIASIIPAIKGGQLAIKGAAKGTEAALTTTGKGLAETGKTVYRSSIRPTAREAERIIRFEGDDITYKNAQKAGDNSVPKPNAPILRVDTGLEKGIAGTQKGMAVQARVESTKLWKENLEPALASSKARVSKDDLFAKARERVATEKEPSRRAQLQKALESLEEDYIDFTDADLLTANGIKSSLANFTPSKIFKGEEVASEVKTLKADMASAIRDKIYKELGGDSKRAYIDYGNLKELEKIGVKPITEGGKLGGFGGFWTSLFDMATVPVKSVGGQVLYKVGNHLQFIGRPGITTFREYAESKGVKVKK
jgi:hypothetical protein